MSKKADRPPRPVINKHYNIVLSTVACEPGDSVLVATQEGVPAEEAHAIMSGLRERFPDTEFTFVAGVNLMKMPPAAAKKFAEAMSGE